MKLNLLLITSWFLISSAAAQSVVRIVSFEKNDGIIDRGTDGGIRVGDVFEVNRYEGDFVYWVGRVEVVVAKSRFAGVKLLAKAAETSLQKGDVLELQQNEIDPMLDKLKQSGQAMAGNGAVAKEAEPKTAAAEDLADFMRSPKRHQRVLFGVTGGLVQPVISSSRLAGSSFLVNVQNVNTGDQNTINMSEAYSTSLAFQAFFVLPLSERLSLNLNYAYAALNVSSRKEMDLLRIGLKGSASLAMVTATVHWLWRNNLQAGVGAGLFLPQASLRSSRQTMTISDRRLGFSLGAAHQLVLGSNLWLRSQLSYNVFLNQGPAIHFLAVQIGPCFGI
ncbi:MAG: hypothetical protein ACREOO_22595 [bacterium]